MDELLEDAPIEVVPPAAEPRTGIYAECPRCWAVVADLAAHEAWHLSRGEEVI